MCSNFEAAISLKRIAQHYAKSVAKKSTPEKTILRPTDDCLVATTEQIEPLTWGLQVNWSKQPLINARAESLFEKKTFQNIVNNRCLVPASAYFEWRKEHEKKFKNRIAIKDIDCFSFAGLTQGERFTILTCAPSKQINHIHSRMPVLIHPSHYEQWLDQEIETRTLTNLLQAPQNITFDIVEEKPKNEQFNLF